MTDNSSRPDRVGALALAVSLDLSDQLTLIASSLMDAHTALPESNPLKGQLALGYDAAIRILYLSRQLRQFAQIRGVLQLQGSSGSDHTGAIIGIPVDSVKEESGYRPK